MVRGVPPAKIANFGAYKGGTMWTFFCPGCKGAHSVQVPMWTWNGSVEVPTFTPSVLVNKQNPATRCHLFVTDGRIQFLEDCHHGLAGQTVDMEDVL